MMSREELDEHLDNAMNIVGHEAYAAAARVHWPNALIDLKEALAQLDVTARAALKNMKAVEAGDRLALAVHAYLKRFCTHGPFDCDKEATELIKASKEYREQRGIGP